jgi:hypothetical protein
MLPAQDRLARPQHRIDPRRREGHPTFVEDAGAASSAAITLLQDLAPGIAAMATLGGAYRLLDSGLS